MKKMLINNKLCNVVTMEEYTINKEIYNPKFTAIELNNGLVLPIKSKTDTGVGIYYQNGGMVSNVEKPEDKDISKYSKDNIIDYSDSKDIGELINKENLVRDIENEILTTKDNIFYLPIGVDDTPAMKGLKDAINTKQVDIAAYEDRFAQYQNDVRLLKGKSITLSKIISSCDTFDIEAEIRFRDKSGCANPMNKEIVVLLTDGRS